MLVRVEWLKYIFQARPDLEWGVFDSANVSQQLIENRIHKSPKQQKEVVEIFQRPLPINLSNLNLQSRWQSHFCFSDFRIFTS